ncbi:hypothetical protein [Rheinheimera fenheensis]|uniref:hypothetical protein n=1 Tax=Rheinheimera fenheensis TaxID=3152295 RepID=UPI003261A2E4
MVISPLVDVKHCCANGSNSRLQADLKLEEGMEILWGFYAEPNKVACCLVLLFNFKDFAELCFGLILVE